MACVHKFPVQRRCLRLVVKVLRNVVLDFGCEFKPYEILMLEDSVCWQPHAETFADGEVDVLGRRNSLRNHINGLADHGLLDSIAQLTGPVLLYDDRHLAASQQEIAYI